MSDVSAVHEGYEEELFFVAVEGVVGVEEHGRLVQLGDVDGSVELLLEDEVALPLPDVLPLDPLEVLRLHLLLLVAVLADVALLERPLQEVLLTEVHW